MYRLFENDDRYLILKRFIQTILNTDFNDNDKREILEALSNNKEPGGGQAFVLNNIKCVQTFTKTIIDSNLPEKIKLSLLNAKDTSGLTALQRAFNNNSTKCIFFFADYILKTNKLSDKAKRNLLGLTKNSTNIKKGFLLVIIKQ